MEELTTKQAADALGIGINAVQKLLKKGLLPGEKFGRDWRIKASDLDHVRGLKPGPKPKVTAAGTNGNTARRKERAK